MVSRSTCASNAANFYWLPPENENGQGAELECTTVLQSGTDGANQKMRSRNKFLNSLYIYPAEQVDWHAEGQECIALILVLCVHLCITLQPC